ncbi:hypothetical protein KR009_005033 [Drosophila setifemur]|nr:hypothetical protein KR009_005033 [Drosophila setifemur]
MSTLFWILWLSTIIPVMTQERHFRLRLDEFSIRFRDPGIFEYVDFRITQLDNRSYVNGEMLFKIDIPVVNVRTSMDFWKPNSQKKFKLYNVRLDACQFLKTFHRNSLLNIYANIFRKHTNADLMCPLKKVRNYDNNVDMNRLSSFNYSKNFSYTLTNWHMDEMDFPSYTPLGTFHTITEFSAESRLALRVVTYGKVFPFN